MEVRMNVDEFRTVFSGIKMSSPTRILMGVRDFILTVLMLPFYAPSWIIGFVAGLLKLIGGAIVTGVKHGFRSVTNG